MRHVLLVILLLTTLVSCSNSSSSKPTPRPPAGKDGVKELQTGDIKFTDSEDMLTVHDVNYGAVTWDKGKDQLAVAGYYLGEDHQGSFVFNEKELGKEAVKRLPAGVCAVKNMVHRWFISRRGVDSEIKSGQLVDFDDKSILYLEVESRSAPQCERALFGFTAVLKSISTKPKPTPVPTPMPTPVPTNPEGSESVVVIRPTNPANFSIVVEGNPDSNFKYKVNMLVNGDAFGKNEVVERIFVSVYDTKFKNYAAPWTEIVKIEPAGVLPGEYRLEFNLDKFSAPSYLIARQKELVLTFAINSYSNSPLPIRSLELAQYCANYRRSFVEVESGITGCQ